MAGSRPRRIRSERQGNVLWFSFSGTLPLLKETSMPFLRRHSNGFQVVIDRHLIEEGWVIYCLVDEEILGLTAQTLAEAKGIADSLAVVSHVEECNDACNEWVNY